LNGPPNAKCRVSKSLRGDHGFGVNERYGLFSSTATCLWNTAPIKRKVLAMKRVAWYLLLTTCAAVALAQTGQQDSKTEPPPNLCDAAAAKLREANTHRVVLMLRLDNKGRVQSFKTESPKGLRLEKMKEAATEIRKIRFAPAKQYGSPDVVKVRVEFDCSTGHPTSVTNSP